MTHHSKQFLLLGGIILLCLSCKKFDPGYLEEQLNNHEARLQQIEQRINTINTSIAAIYTTLNAIECDLTVSSIESVSEGTGGYKITFSDGSEAIIMNGRDGMNSGDAPSISVDTEGYWLINGQRITSNGQNVKAIGKDGNNGNDGNNGKDGETPIMGVDSEGYWTVTVNSETQRITDDKGEYVKALGENGKNEDSFFKSVTITDDYIVFVLNDSETSPTHVTIPWMQPEDNLLTVTIDKAGTLNSLLTKQQLRTTRRIKVIGNINAQDIATINGKMTAIEFVDLSEAICSRFDDMHYAFCGGETFAVSTTDWAAYGNLTLRTIILPPIINNLTHFFYPFEGCSKLETVIVPKGGDIWSEPYAHCYNLESLIYQEGITELNAHLQGQAQAPSIVACSPFPYVELPSTIRQIDREYFANCQPKTVVIKAIDPPKLSSGTSFLYLSVSAGWKLLVPSESIDKYKTADGWSQFKNLIYPIQP